MNASELTLTVDVKRRGFFDTLLQLPRCFAGHYRTARRGNGIIVSLYAAWLMTRLLITFRPSK
jgi:hypothetical protein